VTGTYSKINTDFVAGTVATLLITFKNGSTLSCDALIGELDTPGGPAKGGMMELDVTFEISGTMSFAGVG
jgi:hypothetical protein